MNLTTSSAASSCPYELFTAPLVSPWARKSKATKLNLHNCGSANWGCQAVMPVYTLWNKRSVGRFSSIDCAKFDVGVDMI